MGKKTIEDVKENIFNYLMENEPNTSRAIALHLRETKQIGGNIYDSNKRLGKLMSIDPRFEEAFFRNGIRYWGISSAFKQIES